jgi:hypothetical protein
MEAGVERQELMEILASRTRKEALEGLWHNLSAAPDRFWLELAEVLGRVGERAQSSLCWLFKRRLGLKDDPQLVSRLFALGLEDLPAMARVDLMQAFCLCDLRLVPRESLRALVDSGLDHANLFLRAWALSLLCQGSQSRGEWRAEAASRLAEACTHEKPSLRARARTLLARHPYLFQPGE